MAPLIDPLLDLVVCGTDIQFASNLLEPRNRTSTPLNLFRHQFVAARRPVFTYQSCHRYAIAGDDDRISGRFDLSHEFV